MKKNRVINGKNWFTSWLLTDGKPYWALLKSSTIPECNKKSISKMTGTVKSQSLKINSVKVNC